MQNIGAHGGHVPQFRGAAASHRGRHLVLPLCRHRWGVLGPLAHASFPVFLLFLVPAKPYPGEGFEGRWLGFEGDAARGRGGDRRGAAEIGGGGGRDAAESGGGELPEEATWRRSARRGARARRSIGSRASC